MVTRFPSLVKKITHSVKIARDLLLIKRSTLFDKNWYLANNPDIQQARVNPWLHYLFFGGFEGRNPSPSFDSRRYLENYPDVKNSGINPLIHYLKYGEVEGRLTYPQAEALLVEAAAPPYHCSVCNNPVIAFLPLSSFYLENLIQYGYPYTFDEAETLNSENYACPHCGASDRDRLYACYLEKRFFQCNSTDQLLLLDIAPLVHLGKFFDKFTNIHRHTADLYREGVDFVLDITAMPEIASATYDVVICSHVLEHVSDDKSALSELYRILKPGGWAIIMVPVILTIDEVDEDPQVTDAGERWRRFGQHDHVRLYSKRGFIERVESAGFTLRQLGVDYFGEAVFRIHGITNKSVLYIAEKGPLSENG